MLDTTLNARIQAFLDQFDAALAAGDIDAAVGMFAPECYWRDLVAFTWNIKTMRRSGLHLPIASTPTMDRSYSPAIQDGARI